MSSSDVQVVLCTCPEEAAEGLARRVTEASLAACVNILPGVKSVYRWEGAVEEATESLLILKTTQARREELQAFLHANHPYDVPEVIALDVESGLEGYLAWVRQETAPATATERAPGGGPEE